MDLSRFVYAVYDSLTKPIDFGLEKSLHKGDLQSLYLIVENPGITAAEIVSVLGRTKGTTSQSISKLKFLGLVEQKADQNNAKNLPLFALPKGIEINNINLEREKVYDQKLIDNYFNDITDEAKDENGNGTMKNWWDITEEDMNSFFKVITKYPEIMRDWNR